MAFTIRRAGLGSEDFQEITNVRALFRQKRARHSTGLSPLPAADECCIAMGICCGSSGTACSQIIAVIAG